MTKPLLKAIAVLEIIGGIFGVAFAFWALWATRSYPYGDILAPIPIAIDVLSFFAGVELWRGRRSGRTASIIIQTIQLPKIISPAVVFMFSFGFDVWIRLLLGRDFAHFGFDSSFLAFHRFAFYAPDAPFDFGVSITAWISLVILLRYKTDSSSEKEITPTAAN